MSMKSYKARGIVLHTLKYGDSGMVVYLLTDSGGRQSYMVQGVRSARGHGSKLALFQPMFAVEFEGLESSRMQMHRFREVRSGIVLQSLPFDVRKSTIALFMAEVLYRLVKECEPNQRLFDFVWGSVAALDALDEGVANFHLWFLTNLSPVSGLFAGQRLPAGGVVRHPRGFVHAAAAAARRGAFGRRRPHPARPVGVRRTLHRRDRTQPPPARGLSRRPAGLLRLPPRRDSRRAVGKDFAGGILTNRKPEYSYDEQERFR